MLTHQSIQVRNAAVLRSILYLPLHCEMAEAVAASFLLLGVFAEAT